MRSRAWSRRRWRRDGGQGGATGTCFSSMLSTDDGTLFILMLSLFSCECQTSNSDAGVISGRKLRGRGGFPSSDVLPLSLRQRCEDSLGPPARVRRYISCKSYSRACETAVHSHAPWPVRSGVPYSPHAEPWRSDERPVLASGGHCAHFHCEQEFPRQRESSLDLQGCSSFTTRETVI